MAKTILTCFLFTLASCSSPHVLRIAKDREPVPPIPLQVDLYPISLGASWTFRGTGSCKIDGEGRPTVREVTQTVTGMKVISWQGAPVSAFELTDSVKGTVTDTKYAAVVDDHVLLFRSSDSKEYVLDFVLPRHRRVLQDFNYGPELPCHSVGGRAHEIDFKGPFGSGKAVNVRWHSGTCHGSSERSALLVPGVGPVILRVRMNWVDWSEDSTFELIAFQPGF